MKTKKTCLGKIGSLRAIWNGSYNPENEQIDEKEIVYRRGRNRTCIVFSVIAVLSIIHALITDPYYLLFMAILFVGALVGFMIYMAADRGNLGIISRNLVKISGILIFITIFVVDVELNEWLTFM